MGCELDPKIVYTEFSAVDLRKKQSEIRKKQAKIENNKFNLNKTMDFDKTNEYSKEFKLKLNCDLCNDEFQPRVQTFIKPQKSLQIIFKTNEQNRK